MTAPVEEPAQYQHRITPRVRRRAYSTLVTLCCAVIIINLMILIGVNPLWIILSTIFSGGIILWVDSRSSIADTRSIRCDNFLEAIYPYLRTQRISRSLMHRHQWKRNPEAGKLYNVGYLARVRLRFGRTIDSDDPGFRVALAQIAARELGDNVATYRIERVNHTQKWVDLYGEIPQIAPAVPLTSEQQEEERLTAGITSLLGEDATVQYRWDNGQLESVIIHHTVALEMEMMPTKKRRVTAALLEQLPGLYTPMWDTRKQTLIFSRREELPELVQVQEQMQTVCTTYTDYKKFTVYLGVDEQNRWARWSPTRDSHLVIVGATNSGKTVVLHNVIQQCAQAGFRVWLSDGKFIELLGYDQWPNVELIANSVPTQIRTLKRLHELMQDRYSLIRDGKARLEDFDPIFYICDEVTEMKANIADFYATHKVKGMPAKSRVDEWIGSLARLARKAMIHLVFGLQRADADIFGGETRENFAARLSLGRMGAEASKMIWGHPSVGSLIPAHAPKGRALASLDGVPTVVQTVLAPNPNPLDPDYDQQQVHRMHPAVTVYTQKFLREPEEMLESTTKDGESIEVPRPWDEYLKMPFYDAQGHTVDFEPCRSLLAQQILAALSTGTQHPLSVPEPSLSAAQTQGNKRVLNEPSLLPSEELSPLPTRTVYVEQLKPGDIILIEDEPAVVESTFEDPFDENAISIDYRLDNGDIGGYSLSIGDTVTIEDQEG